MSAAVLHSVSVYTVTYTLGIHHHLYTCPHHHSLPVLIITPIPHLPQCSTGSLPFYICPNAYTYQYHYTCPLFTSAHILTPVHIFTPMSPVRCRLTCASTAGHCCSARAWSPRMTVNSHFTSSCVTVQSLLARRCLSSELGRRPGACSSPLVLLLLLVDRLPADRVPHGVDLADGLPGRPALRLCVAVPADRGGRSQRCWSPSRRNDPPHSLRLRRRRALADLPLLRVQVCTDSALQHDEVINIQRNCPHSA